MDIRERTHKIYELVFANGTSRDNDNTREDHREIGGHGSQMSVFGKSFHRLSFLRETNFQAIYNNWKKKATTGVDFTKN